ncbi:MAG: MarR family transcriptional regulator [Deltaproteobacteria bacterium]|nr:MarR family transcriptional regulator [Deltaproteobacteria bacterium]MDQ3299998.1 MarR family transcriptional regulator [Myxococcota bacterium]
MTARKLDPHRPTGETLQFMQRLWRLTHALEVRSKRMARTLGVTGPQRLVVRLIGQTPNLSARDLASTLGIHPSTLTGIVARLEAQRMIVREADAKDRRKTRFRLTADGERVDRERKGTVETAVRRALGKVDPDVVVHTVMLLDQLAAELERAE